MVQKLNVDTKGNDAPEGKGLERKDVSVPNTVFCQDCSDSSIHQTGSQLWVSCSFVRGWRSINSECCLPVEEQQKRTECKQKIVKALRGNCRFEENKCCVLIEILARRKLLRKKRKKGVVNRCASIA